MSRTFSDLKKSRTASFKTLTDKLTQLATGQNFGSDDPRFWQPTVDKEGNGYAVIRYLPAPGDEDLPFVMIYDHGFQGPGGWYIEKSLTTIGQQDPLAEYNTQLWQRNQPGDREFVSGTPSKGGAKRRLQYYSNILVVEDPAKPENNGKVFLYKYGKKIFEKINEASNPKFPDEKPVDPFDLWEGANFKLKIRKVEGYRNYDKSEFDDPSPAVMVKKGGKIVPDEEAMQAIWESEHSLKEFHDPKNFKTYAELKAKLNRALGLEGARSGMGRVEDESPIPATKAKPAKVTPPWEDEETPKASTDEDDDDLAAFQKLAKA